MEEPDVDLILIDGYLMTREGYPWHRIVCRRAHGPIPSGWDVHHIDGDRLNNEPSNLIAIPKKIHAEIHKVARNGVPFPSRNAIGKHLEWSLLGREGPSPLDPNRKSRQQVKQERKKRKVLEAKEKKLRRKQEKEDRKRFTEKWARLDPAEMYGPWPIKRYEYQPPAKTGFGVGEFHPRRKKKFEPKTIRISR